MSEDLHSSTIVGWREWVQLPGIGIPWIKAKLDTGARSSALAAFDIVEVDGGKVVRFKVRPWQGSTDDVVEVECPIHDRRVVRSSSGHAEERLVILLELELAGQSILAETTLTQRHQLDFRMLVGREALRQGFLINPRKSYLAERAPKEIRRRNRRKI